MAADGSNRVDKMSGFLQPQKKEHKFNIRDIMMNHIETISLYSRYVRIYIYMYINTYNKI